MDTSLLNAGDTSWMLMSTALVMLMTPGLAFFYAGLVKKRNVVNTLMMSMIALGVISLVWMGVGYSLAFAPGNPWVGGFDFIALSGVDMQPQEGSTIPHNLFMGFQMMFAIITPALISGALVGRMKFTSYILFIILWSIGIYSPLCHWVWGGGWLAEHGALDFAGGTVVHISAGVSALVAAMVLGPRDPKERVAAHAHDVPMTVLGAALLWMGWFGFNAGSALAADGIAAHALVTTHLAAGAGLATWVLLDLVLKKRAGAVGASIGAVVGLVTITPAAGFVTVTGAVVMGILGASASYATLRFLSRRNFDDTLDVFACHGVGGIVGSILTGVFASAKVNPGSDNGLIYGNIDLMLPQTEATLATILFAGAGTALLLKLLEMTVGIRVQSPEEDNLDRAQHSESAYATHSNLPLGQLVIQHGLASQKDIESCLSLQKKEENPEPLGSMLIQRGLLTESLLQQLLLTQALSH
ncbi:MAG: ammonium transporter [Deltaproteobacteria bacterium]|jgi:ammonium transporter, Amt family|nr:ammonium transporter [Deltaproteobacteria bacterium]MBT6491552.1 ammonium transporter [Deltaproteobacteria bacterium]